MERIPRKKNPSTTSAALTIHINAPTFHFGNKVERIIDRPDVPPNAKWLGVLKMAIPTRCKNQSQIQNDKEHQVVFCKYIFFHKTSPLLLSVNSV